MAGLEAYDRIEALIRNGELGRARSELDQWALGRVQGRRIPERLRHRVANFYRRLGEPLRALTQLNSIVRSGRRPMRDLDAPVLLEQGAALVAAGASEEGVRYLNAAVQKKELRAKLFLAFDLFGQWNYPDAVPHLESYIKISDLSAYERSVGEVNLLAALIVCGKIIEAEDLYHGLLDSLVESGAGRLMTNVLELGVQMAIEERKSKLFSARISEAGRRVKKDSTEYWNLQRWQCEWDFQVQGRAPNLKKITYILAAALRGQRWEFARDVRLLAASSQKSAQSFLRLWWGTCHQHFRDRVKSRYETIMEKSFESGEEFAWSLVPDSTELATGLLDSAQKGRGSTQQNAIHVFSPIKGTWKGKSVLGQPSLLGLALALSEDLYRPARLATIHSRISAGEHFNPLSSPNLVHQLLFRLRREFAKHRVGLRVERGAGSYSWAQPTEASLLLGAQRRLPKADHQINQWLSQLPEHFTVSDFVRVSAQSRRSAQRRLMELVQAGQIRAAGLGRGSHYEKHST